MGAHNIYIFYRPDPLHNCFALSLGLILITYCCTESAELYVLNKVFVFLMSEMSQYVPQEKKKTYQ